MPTDLEARILWANISLDEAAFSIDLAVEQAGLFGMLQDQGKIIASEVATAVMRWRDVAAAAGQSQRQINRMESAFEHTDLEKALGWQ